MYTTSVVVGIGQPRQSRSSRRLARQWPVTKRTPVASPRWVSGMPAAAAQPAAAVTPGTTSNGIPARARPPRLLAAAAEDRRDRRP